jgi:hypothetical protein
MPLRRIIAVVLFACSVLPSFSQKDYSIRLKSETIDYTALEMAALQVASRSEVTDTFAGYRFRIAQFEELLTEVQIIELAQKGIKVNDYLENGGYVLAFAEGAEEKILQTYQLRWLSPLQTAWKLHPNLKEASNHTWAMEGNATKVHVILQTQVPMNEAVAALKLFPNVLRVDQTFQGITVLAQEQHLSDIAALPFVLMLELIAPPPIADDEAARASAQANLSNPFTGFAFTGKGVNVLVRDDGVVGPHIDFQGRLSNMTSSNLGGHGDGVSGVLGGAGNLNPDARGIAPGATIFTLPYESTFNDLTLSMHLNNQVMITNTSYSDGCNIGYTTAARTVDMQLYQNKQLMHVFSSGNSNTTDCGYGAGTYFGNITGGHKQSKNSITVGNVDNLGSIVNSSSRGPATDGRIKPDVVAPGFSQLTTGAGNTYAQFGGTSASAPVVTGGLALLYESYQAKNNQQNPPAALVKAAVLNTCTDLGNAGPDFTYGWGMVNFQCADQLISNNQYFQSSIGNNETKLFNIPIPTGVREARVMVYWADPAASVLAQRALVNQIDVQIISMADGIITSPWVLDHSPIFTNLSKAATRGIDTKNNVEQVTLFYPNAGQYQLKVTGSSVPIGPQEFWVVYEYIYADIEISYPNGGEHFDAGEVVNIHWHGPPGTNGFTLKYSINQGVTWTQIGLVSGLARSFAWTIPAGLNQDQVLISVNGGSKIDISNASFVVKPYLKGLEANQLTSTSSKIMWRKHPTATSYEVFQLGQTNMQIIGTTTDTTFTVNHLATPVIPLWFSARPIFSGAKGKRALAVQPKSLPCTISATVSNLVCQQNGTPSQPNDDTYTLQLTVNQIGLCGSAWITAGGAIQTATPYGQAKTMGPYPMSQASQTITVLDQINSAFTTIATVQAPAPCSVIPPAQTCSGNLIKNGGFEQNGLSFWYYDTQVTAHNAGNGSIAKICGNGKRLYQFIKVDASKAYDFGFQAQAAATTANFAVTVRFYTNTWAPLSEVISPILTINNQWTAQNFTHHSPNLAYWMEVSVAQSGQDCIALDDFCVQIKQQNPSNQSPDLQLNISSTLMQPGIYKSAPIKLVVRNSGTQKADDIDLAFLNFSDPNISNQIAFVSSTVSKGNLNDWTGKWSVGTLNPNEEAMLDLVVFTKTSAKINCFAQVTRQTPNDTDSSPNNNLTSMPSEDDEALLSFNQTQTRLQSSEPQAIDPDQVTDALTVFPNPAVTELCLSCADCTGKPVDIMIVNSMGTLVFQSKLDNWEQGMHALPLSQLANGMYLLSIKTAGQRERIKSFAILKE